MRYAVALSRLVRKGRNGLVAVERAVLIEIRALRARLPQVAGALVAGVDGLLIAHDLPGVEPERFAAMSAAQLGLGRQVAATAARGAFAECITRASNGYVATFAAGSEALLAVVASADLNVGLLHHEARPIAARIGEIVTPAAHNPDRNPTRIPNRTP